MSAARAAQILFARATHVARKPRHLACTVKFYSTGQPSNYEYIKVETTGEKKNIGLITLNRPKSLNALCNNLMSEVVNALSNFTKDDSIGAVVITGDERAFAAGADIKEMSSKTFSNWYRNDSLDHWNKVAKNVKPTIAAVNGYALGGGCELAMACDIIYAGDKAKFGQPEITIGAIPGAGGTQRLIKNIGKSKAMEMILSGIPITAQEAEQSGLVSKVFPADKVVGEAVKLGEKIAAHSPLIVSIAKEAVNTSFETVLEEGLHVERRLFQATFATADNKEGMKAFIEKRPPKFTNE